MAEDAAAATEAVDAAEAADAEAAVREGSQPEGLLAVLGGGCEEVVFEV